MATWEDERDIKEAFPRAPAWGQAGSEEGRDVSNLPDLKLKSVGRHGGGKDGGSTKEAAGPNKRSERIRRPNPKFTGGPWAAK